MAKECLAAIADTSISGYRVARELTTLIERRGRPGLIVSDNAYVGKVGQLTATASRSAKHALAA
jgi:hypothetical protein